MSAYNDFVLTNEQLELIRSVTDEDGKVDWNSPVLADIKGIIKALHLALQNQACCYCRRSFTDEFNMVIDIEHILPKDRFHVLTFDPVNLSVSCKRCNMRIKRGRIDFLNSVDDDYTIRNRFLKEIYQIIHPNVDIYRQHLSYRSHAVDDNRLVKYTVVGNSGKGMRTYDYFELQKFEVGSIDEIQGGVSNADFSYVEFVERALDT